MADATSPRTTGRSVLAIVAGFLAGALLSIATDIILHAVHFFSPLGTPPGNGALAVATIYRAAFSVLGCYLTARLAPRNPMKHALILGALGVVVSAIGAAATWNRSAEFGPHWYPVTLIVISLPCAWLGGMLYQLRPGASQ